MRYVLDASVAVASLRASEPKHAAAASYLAGLFTGRDAIAVPALFSVEIASALARAGMAAYDTERAVTAFLARAAVTTIGPKRAAHIRRVATATRLRAADATYAWLAAREGIPLVTLDREVVARAASVCQVISL